jgi:hypothetical protein
LDFQIFKLLTQAEFQFALLLSLQDSGKEFYLFILIYVVQGLLLAVMLQKVSQYCSNSIFLNNLSPSHYKFPSPFLNTR